jgi:spermidine synthase
MDYPNLNVMIEDARFALQRMGSAYDLIAIDAYRPPYIPWQLTTVEFFQEVRAHLSENGVVAVNVGRTNDDRELVDAMSATLLDVFADVHVLDVPHTFNSILVHPCGHGPTHADRVLA